MQNEGHLVAAISPFPRAATALFEPYNPVRPLLFVSKCVPAHCSGKVWLPMFALPNCVHLDFIDLPALGRVACLLKHPRVFCVFSEDWKCHFVCLGVHHLAWRHWGCAAAEALAHHLLAA
uniref:Uncharacterized protein n=1 Tax=Eutreptiella gymnastica TaxID=73025 RepID=A0A7S4FPJ3_9EUGL